MKSKKLKKQLQSTDPNSLGIAKRLKEIRTKEGLTQLEWSKIINMSPPAVGALENAWYLPNLDVLKKIKKKYGYVVMLAKYYTQQMPEIPGRKSIVD